jgi:hypothetical protein
VGIYVGKKVATYLTRKFDLIRQQEEEAKLLQMPAKHEEEKGDEGQSQPPPCLFRAAAVHEQASRPIDANGE